MTGILGTFDRALWLKEIPPYDCVCEVMGADMDGDYLIFVNYKCPIHGYEAQTTKDNPTTDNERMNNERK